MIFNSPQFLLLFLPVIMGILFLLYKLKLDKYIAPALLLGSLFFYGYSSIVFLVILCSSIIINFYVGKQINESSTLKKTWLICGIVINVGYIVLFKYTNFLGQLLPYLPGNNSLSSNSFILPLGISFYTFTQLGFLIDQYEGANIRNNLLHHALFVSFFPTVTSGPIIQYEDVGTQMEKLTFRNINTDKVTRGITLFIMGMFKKVILADAAASLANGVYKAISLKIPINTFEAWCGALGFSFQIYFDFSGYSDMALGLALMLGISIPWNFNSPYKAINIVDFWRRWHISLSNWLNNYLFEPINYNINKRWKKPSILNVSKSMWAYLIGTFVTMFLCGLWHGATLAFIFWGVLHAILIFINRWWNIGKKHLPWISHDKKDSALVTWVSRILTFVVVTFTWVLFRSPDLATAKAMWKGMIGGNGIYVRGSFLTKLHLANENVLAQFHLSTTDNGIITTPTLPLLSVFFIFLGIIWLLPNTREIITNDCQLSKGKYFGKVATALKIQNGWQPTFLWVIIISLMTVSLVSWNNVSEFLYFNF